MSRNDSFLWQKIKWNFPWNLSRNKSVQSCSVICPTSFWALSLVSTWNLISFHRDYRIVPLFAHTFACVCACVRICVFERERDRESGRIIEYGVSCLRCNKMLNSDKTTDFARFGERPLSKYVASESGFIYIWNMKCMVSALVPD